MGPVDARANAPGTGTPELGGLSSRALLAIIQGLSGLNRVGADLVEVAPPCDRAEITSLAAATIVHKPIGLLAATKPAGDTAKQPVARSIKQQARASR